MIASSAFVALDAILDWPVSLYDASWSQWGQLSASSANGGQLDIGSPFRTDVPSRSELFVYNYGVKPVELLALDGTICSSSTSTLGITTTKPAGCTPLLPNSFATGNEIEEADAAYFGAGGSASGGGTGGGPIAPGY